MSFSLRAKLFATLAAASVLVAVGTFLFMRWSFDRDFIAYVDARQNQSVNFLVTQLEGVYQREGSWHALAADRVRWIRLLASITGDSEEDAVLAELAARTTTGPWPPSHIPRISKRGPMPLAFRIMLLDAAHKPIHGRLDAVADALAVAIHHGANVVGYLAVLPVKHRALQLLDDRFASRHTLSLLFAAILMAVLAVGLAVPVSGRLVRPLRAMQRGARRLADGDYHVRLPVAARDEIGSLARAFNELARTLERNEALRRQWFADISHDLRTPLTVLGGEVEAIIDGVRQPTPEALVSLQQEVAHLSRLVEDLNELAMSDLGALTYHQADVDLAHIAGDVADGLAPQFAAVPLTLVRELDETVIVHGDADRLAQLFTNLLTNSMRYTDGGGTTHLTVATDADGVRVVVADTAPGVAPEELPRLFERLYRTESSRNRASGGSGLGLAICRNIVDAHGGTIEARESPSGGVAIHVFFPAASTQGTA